MDHTHMHGASGMPDPVHLQKMYWAAVGSVIGVATLANFINHLLLHQRLHDRTFTPSKPKSLFFRTYATLTALTREASNLTPPPLSIPIFKHRLTIYFIPLGPLSQILFNLMTVLVLCFYKLNTLNQWSWEEIGYRTGFITIAQLPLLFLLSSRRNLISMFTNTSYARLNTFHRWVARTLWLCATIHMCFWFRSWGRYNYILKQLQTNDFAKRGFAAWCVLTLIVVLSFRPIRRVSYEVFVFLHILLAVGFLVAVWFHANEQGRVWVWVSVGLLLLDRVVRFGLGVFINISIFHGGKTRANVSRSFWAHRATFTPLPGNVTRVTIDNPKTKWQPGQYMFLTCHAVAPVQSHPFAIASISEDQKIEFFVRAEKGGTKRFLKYAERDRSLLGPESKTSSSNGSSRAVFLEGPYGTLRPLRQFDTVVLVAGGMGATLTVPLLRDIIARWKKENTARALAVTRRIHFVWVVRSRAHLAWFKTQLLAVLLDADACRRAALESESGVMREVQISIYVTGKGGEEAAMELEEMQPSLQESARRDSSDTRSVRGSSLEKDSIVEGGGQNHRHSQSSASPGLSPIPGRPPTRKIIRSALETATGESAVIVCGPESLSDDVRRSVVYLSDERAVHKGTGAQGVYLHVESFGW